MNLYLVTSPFQYICALEAKKHFNTKKNILLLVNQVTEAGKKQQQKLIKESDWDYIITLERSNRSVNVPKAIKKIKKIIEKNKIQNFFYAEYNGWRTKLLIKNLPIEREIYFDDGTLTLLEAEEFIKNKVPFHRPRFIQDIIVRLNGCVPIGLLPQTENLEIFTLFDLGKIEQKIHKNTLSALTSFYGNPSLYHPDSPIGFIGQGAIGDKKQKSIEQYVNEIFSFAKKMNKNIIYFPHRTETKEIKDILENSELVTYHQSEFPLEIELIDKKIMLSSLIGTFSTVMFTCRQLYPEMPIYSISATHPNKTFQEIIKKEMKKINVQELDC